MLASASSMRLFWRSGGTSIFTGRSLSSGVAATRRRLSRSLSEPLHLVGPHLDGVDGDWVAAMLEDLGDYLARHLAFDLFYEEREMAKIPGNGARIAGQDYTSFNDDDIDDNLSDLDLGPKGLTVENGSGHAAENDPTR